ncbi:MAG: hypothetical protein IJP10_01490 [Clostridia bacterium]|nr:hypothetical protein [Clostridia bacterium]
MIIKISPFTKSSRMHSFRVSYRDVSHIIDRSNPSCETECISGENNLHIEDLGPHRSVSDFFRVALKAFGSALSAKAFKWSELFSPILADCDISFEEGTKQLELEYKPSICKSSSVAEPIFTLRNNENSHLVETRLRADEKTISRYYKLTILFYALIFLVLSALSALLLSPSVLEKAQSENTLIITAAVLIALFAGGFIWSFIYHRSARRKLITQVQNICSEKNTH